MFSRVSRCFCAFFERIGACWVLSALEKKSSESVCSKIVFGARRHTILKMVMFFIKNPFYSHDQKTVAFLRPGMNGHPVSEQSNL